MIKSSNISLKFSNPGKTGELARFQAEYSSICLKFIELLWPLEKVPALPPKAITETVKGETWLSARAIQACAKQAAGIVRGTRQKNERRLWQANKLIKEGKPKQARKLLAIIRDNPARKPEMKKVNPQLDGRFVSVEMEKKHFDGWVVLTSLGNGTAIKIPIQKTRHFNKLLAEDWKLKASHATISNNHITLVFEKEDPPKATTGKVLGLDVGIKSVATLSDGQSGMCDKHGWDLDKVQTRLAGRKKGSKNFRKTQAHRKNIINYSLNRIDLRGVKTLRMEKIKDMRKGQRTSAFLSRWTYTNIFDKLEDMCLLAGVRPEYVDPAYTSQRCSHCGWTRKSNRKGLCFKCEKCGFAANSDLNGSLNIALSLPPLGRKKRFEGNKDGFYWHPQGKEPIVPSVENP